MQLPVAVVVPLQLLLISQKWWSCVFHFFPSQSLFIVSSLLHYYTAGKTFLWCSGLQGNVCSHTLCLLAGQEVHALFLLILVRRTFFISAACLSLMLACHQQGLEASLTSRPGSLMEFSRKKKHCHAFMLTHSVRARVSCHGQSVVQLFT